MFPLRVIKFRLRYKLSFKYSHVFLPTWLSGWWCQLMRGFSYRSRKCPHLLHYIGSNVSNSNFYRCTVYNIQKGTNMQHPSSICPPSFLCFPFFPAWQRWAAVCILSPGVKIQSGRAAPFLIFTWRIVVVICKAPIDDWQSDCLVTAHWVWLNREDWVCVCVHACKRVCPPGYVIPR